MLYFLRIGMIGESNVGGILLYFDFVNVVNGVDGLYFVFWYFWIFFCGLKIIVEWEDVWVVVDVVGIIMMKMCLMDFW